MMHGQTQIKYTEIRNNFMENKANKIHLLDCKMCIILDSDIVTVESKSLGMINLFFQNSYSLRYNYKKCG